MFGKREVPGLADAIAIIISPILIMGVVGSLIFFLLEVLYGGDYVGRLRWTFFFFVFGSVLVARISIEFGDAKAAAYAAILGFAALLAMWRFVKYPDGLIGSLSPVINIGLLVLVWWCARKLTCDCTFIDDERDASDRSVLEASGIESLERPEQWRETAPPVADDDAPKVEAGPVGWVQRYLHWRKNQDKKPHTPGVWVVYFSLAALPIFGLGQGLIPVEETNSRNFTFWLMVVYVGCGLGLLMTTAFLGLRRYLKQRKLQIPPTLAGVWLGFGCAIIVGFLAVAAILPRPSSETPLVDISGVTGSKNRDASQFASNTGESGKGDGQAGDEKSEDAQSNNSTDGKSKESGKGKGSDDSSKGSGDNKGKGGDQGKSDQSGNQKGGDKNGEKGKDGDDKKDPGGKNQDASKDEGNKSGGDKSNQKNSSGNKSSRPNKPSNSSKGPASLGSLGKIGTIIKWIVFAILALVVGCFILRHGLKFLSNFTDWAKQLLDFLNNFWSRLFGGTVEKPESDIVEDFANIQKPVRPFSDFANPFDNGTSNKMKPAELVKYSFAALEAWAWQHEASRNPEETPIEFAQRLADEYRSLGQTAPRLAALYARLAYARGSLPESCRDHVAAFWQQLELAHDEALELRRVAV